MNAELNAATAKAAAEWWKVRFSGNNADKLAAHIEKRVREELDKHGRCRLECDYDPFGILLEAVKAANNECRGFMFSARGLLPQKHDLNVTPGKLQPKEGYGRWTDDIVISAADRTADGR